MCLSIPAKVIQINGDMAKVSVCDVILNACLQLTDDVKEGDYVLIHAGFAIQKIDEKEAEETIRLIGEIAAFDELTGNPDSLNNKEF